MFFPSSGLIEALQRRHKKKTTEFVSPQKGQDGNLAFVNF